MSVTGPPEQHEPVLLEEVIDALEIDASGCYIDATYGRGGHSRAVLERLGHRGRLIAFDKDPEACAHAREALRADSRFEIHHASFKQMKNLRNEQISGKIAGIFFDLGVSLLQLKQGQRGFSFMLDGPLDMRMNPQQGKGVAEWLNNSPHSEIRRVIRTYGEEPRAGLIAATIVKSVSRGAPILTTRDLANLVASVSNYHTVRNSTTRVFLALRLFINQELEDLTDVLDHTIALLRKGGRFVAIAFHSLEDRIVKKFVRKYSEAPPTLRGLPSVAAPNQLSKIGKVIYPSPEEIQRNPRSRSARMRIAEKT